VFNREQFVINARGHSNISGKHRTTWQLTKEMKLTPRGHCIIGVESTASTADLPDWLKGHLQNGGTISIQLQVGEENFYGSAVGHPDLTLDDDIDVVFRKGHYKSKRTIAIKCSFVADDLPEIVISKLKDPMTRFSVIIQKQLF